MTEPANQELSPSQADQRFRTLVEHIPMVATYLDIVIPDDPGHSIPVYISPQIEDLLGYPLAAWLGEDELWLKVLHPDDAQAQIAADEEARRTMSPLSAEYRMLSRDGRVVWVSEKAAVVRDEASGTLYWQGVMVDVTERKLAEEALEQSELKFRTIFDAAAIGVLTLGADGFVQEANSTLEGVGGYLPGELVGRNLYELLDPADQRTLGVINELSAGNRDRSDLEHRFRRKDGSWVWCRTVMALVRDSSSRPAYVIGMLEDISDRKRAEDELVRRAVHDPLTGLPNRQLFLDRLGVAIAQSERRGAGLAVIFLDLDRFKQVNDGIGHHAGDELLIGVGRRLTRALRPSDTVARFGGDEFVMLAPDVGSVEDAEQLAERLRALMKRSIRAAGRSLRITASLGVVLSQDGAGTPDELIRNADAAMYLAKERGRDRVEFFESASQSGLAS